MNLLQTTNGKTGARRFYADGKQIPHALYLAFTQDYRLDSFRTEIRGDMTRQMCCAYPPPQSY